jgi:hypothetical protein
MVMGLAHSAGAQAPGQTEPTTAAFLEKRIPEELATEGVVLSRRNLGLQIEQLADKWLVSLVDLTTGRVAASTRVDVLPIDREAAVAAMTHVVAELASQVVGRAELPPAPDPAPPGAPEVEQMLREQQAERAERAARAAREQREAAELAFNRKLIRFTSTYDPVANAAPRAPRARWAAYQGKPDQKMDSLTFYNEVGRPDLAEAYLARRRMMIGSFVVGGLGLATAYVATFYELAADLDCDVKSGTARDMCFDQNGANWAIPAIAFGAGTIAIISGIYYALHRQPIDEGEAKALAHAYNLRLQGAAPAPRSSLLREFRLMPYATEHAGGLVLGARF